MTKKLSMTPSAIRQRARIAAMSDEELKQHNEKSKKRQKDWRLKNKKRVKAINRKNCAKRKAENQRAITEYLSRAEGTRIAKTDWAEVTGKALSGDTDDNQ